MVDIERAEKRTIQYFYSDGLFEIALGLVLLLLGGYFFAETAISEGSAVKKVLSGLGVLVIVSAGFLIGRFLRFFKRRLTYPRTGYVAYKKDRSPRSRRLAAIVGAVIGFLFSALIAISPSVRTLLPAINGLLFAVALLFFANKVGLARLFVLAAASALAGFAVTAAGVGDIKGLGLYYGIFGAAVIVSGLATLVAYLRKTRRPGESSDGI